MIKQLGLFWANAHAYSQLEQENLGGEKNCEKRKQMLAVVCVIIVSVVVHMRVMQLYQHNCLMICPLDFLETMLCDFNFEWCAVTRRTPQ